MILAFEEFSGALKFFESPVLMLNNIRHDYYDKYRVFMKTHL